MIGDVNWRSTTLHLELSPFQPEWAREVASWARSLAEARAWCGHEGHVLPSPSVFREWHEDPDVEAFLLISGDVPIAYGELWLDRTGDEVELARLIVRPGERGRGVGRRLVEELVAVASIHGLGQAYVRVVPENAVALACYGRAGFVRVPREEEERFNAGQPVRYVWLRRRSNGLCT